MDVHPSAIGVLALACAGHGATFARQLWTYGTCPPCPRVKLPWRTKQKDEFDLAVAAEVAERLGESVYAAAHSVGALWMLLTLAYFGIGSKWISDMQGRVFIFSNFTVLCIRVCPKCVLLRMLPLCYVWLMLCLAGYAYLVDYTQIFPLLRAMAAANLMRMGASCVFAQIKSSLVCNLGFAIMNTYAISRIQDQLGADTDRMYSIFIFELIWTCAIVVSTWQRRKSLESECSEKLKNQSLSNESSAMTELLNLVCDVVVELDGRVRVVEHAPRLSAMLGMNRDTQGLALTRYMPRASDQERLEQRLRRKLEGGHGACEPDAMNSMFRDSMNNDIPVEIFCVACQGLGSQRSCFVGIREVSDQPVGRLPPLNPVSIAAYGIPAAQETAGTGVGRQGLGTMPVMESRSLSDGKSPEITAPAQRAAGEACPSASSGKSPMSASSGWRRVEDRFELTSQQAKKFSLVELLMQWNIALPKKSCCAWHAELQDLRSLVKEVLQSRCNTSFHLSGDGQCEGCGIVVYLDEDEDEPPGHCPGVRLRRLPSRNLDVPQLLCPTVGPVLVDL